MSKAFFIDMERCVGCKACQVACKDKNRLGVGTLYREARTFSTGAFPDVRAYSYSFGCNHCDDAACLNNCPTGAISRMDDGTVVQDKSLCIGCRMCVMSCPYGQPKYSSETHTSGKCDGCYGIRAAGGEPACVAACPSRALDFGDEDEIVSKHGTDLDRGDIAVLPSPDLTHPRIFIKAKDSAKEEDFKPVNW